MGKAAGGGVGELARDRRRFERRQTRPEISGDRIPLSLSPLRVKGIEQRERLGDHAPVLKAGQVAPVEVIAPADHDFGASSGQVGQCQSGVGQGGQGGFQDQELLGLAPGDGARHDAMFGRVEGER
jgi:hypothetical protein